jgi:endonuclease/exonuclease/phosphatase family metal-dependent hydrolase
MTVIVHRCVWLAVGCLLTSGGDSLCAEETAWPATRIVAAPEAHQAAAADERFLYAISSTQVAKYDRATGERITVSTGPATHLNSGFFHEGKLYCAHSNYPRTPEQSEILVLDPEIMRLATWKDFGNYGGSLTWAVRRDGAWWCNFARYGAANAETFLVKFDDGWRELGRWTYPPEVIGRLGRNSLSGGLWRDGELLVTGHDDRVLFRLALPEEGTTLQFLGSQSIPFSGQGFAVDPVAGGLIGIDRAKKQLILSDPPEGAARLRVLTYNIHHGEGTDGTLDLERIARVIRAAEPDLVALQEVDQNVARTGSVDQPAELARLTKMHVAFGANIPLQGGKYGNAVLSRHPIAKHKNVLLPCLDEGEQRGVIVAEIDLRGGNEPLLFLATHLDSRPPEAERLASARTINELIAKHGDRPALLLGDLNAVPESETLREFGREWRRSNDAPRLTSPAGDPRRQIDYVLVRPAWAWRVIETRVIEEPVASDHRPIASTLELIRGPQPAGVPRD